VPSGGLQLLAEELVVLVAGIHQLGSRWQLDPAGLELAMFAGCDWNYEFR
jgi:hypothetical protein